MKRTVFVKMRDIGPPAQPLPECYTIAMLHDWIMGEFSRVWKTRPERKLFMTIESETFDEWVSEPFEDFLPQEVIVMVTGNITDDDLIFMMLKYEVEMMRSSWKPARAL